MKSPACPAFDLLEPRRLLASIGDLVWNDLNNNQLVDASETGIGGVTVRLFKDDGNGQFNPAPRPLPWINEIHYDNLDTDVDEGVEIAGAAGLDLKDWSVALYNGGTTYGSVALTGVIPNQAGGFGTLWFPKTGLQNGDADGMALVSPTGQVANFVSYEGPITATDGPAIGKAASAIPTTITEPASTAVGLSLQLKGSASGFAGFTWAGPVAATRGQINAGQTISASPSAGDAPVGTAVTTTAGAYNFTSLSAGTYWVDVDQTSPALAGKQRTTLSDPIKVTVTSAQVVTSADFGYRPTPTTGSIGDKVFKDTNANGTLDAGETGINSVPLKLYKDDGDGVFEPGIAPPAPVWINEFHYQNTGTDADEGFEIAGKSGTVLTDWSVVLYNGPVVYGTVALTGTIPNQLNGAGAIYFTKSGLQNGPNDGLALVDKAGKVVDFISYDGPITATEGPAAGLSSSAVPVGELTDTPAGQSIQRRGNGFGNGAFTWAGPAAASRGTINASQVITAPPAPTGQDFLVLQTTTTGTGTYGFANVAPGTYWVDVTQSAAPLAGLVLTQNTDPRKVTVVAGVDLTNVDFGYRSTKGSLTGIVFNDANDNGVRESAETTLSSRTVYVDLDNDTVFDTGEPASTTNSAGQWRIDGLAPGSFKIRQVVPSGWRQTRPVFGGLSASVQAGVVVTADSFGQTQKGLISGVVFNDTNGDKIRQSTEAGISGRTVFLDLDNDGVLDANERSVLTDSAGTYRFNNLALGTYRVTIVPKTGFQATTPTTGYFSVTLTSGQAATGKLFGQKQI